MTTVLLVGGDLMAKSRLIYAASRADATVESATAANFVARLTETSPSLVVLDLDEAGEDALEALRAAREQNLALPRTVGYFSHVDRALGDAAKQAGCEAFPRGRFWTSLDRLLPPSDRESSGAEQTDLREDEVGRAEGEGEPS